MHNIYHTEAFVLKSIQYGEANKRLWLYTKDFGLVVVVVQGVRKPGAKLASQIGDFAYIKADIIRGKEVWRLISATLIDNPVSHNERNPLSRVYVRTLSMLSRFVSLEENNDFIFNHLIEISKMIKQENINPKFLDGLSLFRIFENLGYISIDLETSVLIQDSLLESISNMNDILYKKIIVYTQKAIEQSHL